MKLALKECDYSEDALINCAPSRNEHELDTRARYYEKERAQHYLMLSSSGDRTDPIATFSWPTPGLLRLYQEGLLSPHTRLTSLPINNSSFTCLPTSGVATIFFFFFLGGGEAQTKFPVRSQTILVRSGDNQKYFLNKDF